jgi:hypothetical protein
MGCEGHESHPSQWRSLSSLASAGLTPVRATPDLWVVEGFGGPTGRQERPRGL